MKDKVWQLEDRPYDTDLTGTKKNWYALALAIITGKSVKYCTMRMGVFEPSEYKKKDEISTETCCVLHMCGISYREIAVILNTTYANVQQKIRACKERGKHEKPAKRAKRVRTGKVQRNS